MTEQQLNVESIFDHAVEIDLPEQRQAYLDEACGKDEPLRRRIEALLRADRDAGSFLEKPPEGLAATIVGGPDDTVDETFGIDSLSFLESSDKPGCLGTLAQYEVVDVVGRGGMGLVLRAYDTKLNRVVAIKVMAPELAANPMAVKRFLREARAAAAVSHDHVVTIHAIEENSRPPFIVMEFIDGQSLQEKIDRTCGLELKETLRIGMQIARGLAAAHEQGLIHRDIKPANILLENGIERVKLTDFGLARAVDDVSVTQTGQIAGTPQFMSPEQAQGHTLDARSDLFSLGSVLYTMCAGHPPFRAETAVAMLRRVTDDDPRSICEVNPEIPDWLEAIIFKLLEKEPDERFQSAEEVAELLGQYLALLQHPRTAAQPRPIVPPKVVESFCGRKLSQHRAALLAKPAGMRSWIPIAAAVIPLLCLLSIGIAGVVIYLKTNYGTIHIEVDDPKTTVAIDDENRIRMQNTESGAFLVWAGEHKLHIRQGDLEFETDLFRVKRGEDVIIRVELFDDKLSARIVDSYPDPAAPGIVIGEHGVSPNAERVAIRTHTGFYWRAVDGGGSKVMADVKKIGATEVFTIEWQDRNRAHAWIKTRGGFYVRGIPDRDGKIELTRKRGRSEQFSFEWIDRDKRTFHLRTRDGDYVRPALRGGSYLETIKQPGRSEVFTFVPFPKPASSDVESQGDLKPSAPPRAELPANSRHQPKMSAFWDHFASEDGSKWFKSALEMTDGDCELEWAGGSVTSFQHGQVSIVDADYDHMFRGTKKQAEELLMHLDSHLSLIERRRGAVRVAKTEQFIPATEDSLGGYAHEYDTFDQHGHIKYGYIRLFFGDVKSDEVDGDILVGHLYLAISERSETPRALAQIRDPSAPMHPEVAGVLELFDDATGSQRISFVEYLEKLGREEAPLDAMEVTLTLAFREDDEQSARRALRAVAEIGEESGDAALLAVPLMVAMMTDRQASPERRVLAARAIGEIGEQQPRAYKVQSANATLIKIAKDDSESSEDLADMALWALREIAQRDAKSVKLWTAELQQIAKAHASDRVRRRASEVLRKLIESTKDDDQR